jgi:hypothetical protein
MTITGGDHLSPVFNAGSASRASQVTMLDFLRWALYGDAAQGPAGRRCDDRRPDSFESSL